MSEQWTVKRSGRATRISSGGQQLCHHSRQKSDDDGSNEMQHALGLRDLKSNTTL